MSNIVIRIASAEAVTEPPIQLYRQPHDVEIYHYDEPEDWRYGGDGYRDGSVRKGKAFNTIPLPEVYRCKDSDHATQLSCAWLHLWKNINPELTRNSWGTLLDSGLAWMNDTGSPPHSNCVTKYIGDGKSPSFHTPIRNGGAILKGVEQDGFLLVENLHTSNPVPTSDYVLERPWLWYWGTSVRKDGGINYIVRKGLDGTMKHVRIPFITRLPVKIPLEQLHKLPLGSPIPPPTWMA